MSLESLTDECLKHQRNLHALVSVLSQVEVEVEEERGLGTQMADLDSDVRFLSVYKDMYDSFIGQSYSNSHTSSSGKGGIVFSVENVSSIEHALALAPLGAKVHLLKVSLIALTATSSISTSNTASVFSVALLERLMVSLEEITSHHSSSSSTSQSMRLSDDLVFKLRLSLSTELSKAFVVAKSQGNSLTSQPDAMKVDMTPTTSIRHRATASRPVTTSSTDPVLFSQSASELLDLPSLVW